MIRGWFDVHLVVYLDRHLVVWVFVFDLRGLEKDLSVFFGDCSFKNVVSLFLFVDLAR